MHRKLPAVLLHLLRVQRRRTDFCTAQLLFQSSAVLEQSHKDEQLGQLEAKEVQLSQPSSTSLLSHDLFWANLKVQLHLPPHCQSKISLSFDLAWNLDDDKTLTVRNILAQNLVHRGYSHYSDCLRRARTHTLEAIHTIQTV